MKKYTVIAANTEDNKIETFTFPDEIYFLRWTCEALALGVKIVYAAEITIVNDGGVFEKRLTQYYSNLH